MAKIESITKFGFVANGKKYRYEDVTVDRALIVPGADVALLDEPTPAVDAERAKVFTPKFHKQAEDSKMRKEEWASKDLRISRQGVIQAAVIALAPVVSLEALPEEAVKLATAMLGFVNSK